MESSLLKLLTGLGGSHFVEILKSEGIFHLGQFCGLGFDEDSGWAVFDDFCAKYVDLSSAFDQALLKRIIKNAQEIFSRMEDKIAQEILSSFDAAPLPTFSFGAAPSRQVATSMTNPSYQPPALKREREEEVDESPTTATNFHTQSSPKRQKSKDSCTPTQTQHTPLFWRDVGVSDAGTMKEEGTEFSETENENENEFSSEGGYASESARDNSEHEEQANSSNSNRSEVLATNGDFFIHVSSLRQKDRLLSFSSTHNNLIFKGKKSGLFFADLNRVEGFEWAKGFSSVKEAEKYLNANNPRDIELPQTQSDTTAASSGFVPTEIEHVFKKEQDGLFHVDQSVFGKPGKWSKGFQSVDQARQSLRDRLKCLQPPAEPQLEIGADDLSFLPAHLTKMAQTMFETDKKKTKLTIYLQLFRLPPALKSFRETEVGPKVSVSFSDHRGKVHQADGVTKKEATEKLASLFMTYYTNEELLQDLKSVKVKK